jgi:subtilisin family serine protease
LFVLIGLCGLVTPAWAEPAWSPRAHMVLTGRLPPSSVGDGISDGRGRFTVRAQTPLGALHLIARGAVALSPTVFELRANAAELSSLRADPALDGARVEERRLLFPTLNKADAAVGASAARAKFAVDGTGVLVAVVDTGLDLTHADFRDATGKTRVAALLDVSQTGDNKHPELPVPAGRVRLAADIDAALVAGSTLEQDKNGHGTHVAGIAVGNGLATGNGLPAGRYVGMAPGASLVVVKATRAVNTFLDGDVIAGCNFAVEVQKLLGRPLAINLSLGGPGGPHDGSSNFEVALDEIVGDVPGRALVIAAGNDGADDNHAGGWALDGEAVLPLTFDGIGSVAGTLSIDLWYSGTLAITVEAPDGTVSRPIGAGDSDAGPPTTFGQATIDNGPVPASGLHSASLSIAGPDDTHGPHGDWRIHLVGSSPRWDAYIVESASSPRFTDHLSADGRLALPATAHNAIVVGAFVSRASWITADGRSIGFDILPGAVAGFSAAGPTVDGRFAPDVIAPGEYVLSSLSIDAPPTSGLSAFFVPGDSGLAVADDGVHAALRGTSQAAPIVAGTLALLLATDGSLTGSQLRELVRAGARPLTGEPGFSSKSGFGLLAVGDVLALATHASAGPVDASTSTLGVNRDAIPPGADAVRVSLVPRDASGAPIGGGHQVSLTTTLGTIDPILDTGTGRYEALLHLGGSPRGSTAHLTAAVDGVPLNAAVDVWVVFDRSEIGRPFSAAGGCAIGRAPRLVALPLLLAIFLLLLRRRA